MERLLKYNVTHTNPWNAIYKIAANKTRSNHTMTTLKKTKGTITTNLEETMETMAEHLIPKDDATTTRNNTQNKTTRERKNTNKRRQDIQQKKLRMQ